MDRMIFNEEQEHLSSVYARLEAAQGRMEKELAALSREAAGDRQDMLSNLRVDSADEEVLMESYGEIETWNQYIDAYNVRTDVLSDRLRQVRILLNAPYFARVRLRFDPEEEPEDYYIGRASYTENGTDNVVIDWRAPVAETYYSQENGATSYEVDGRRIPVELLLRRQFDLAGNHLRAYFDTSLAIEDPLLVRSLSRRHSNRLQDITVTIQKEQNAVIRHPDVPVLLVSGIAGSGKTSVLLQRIAYLFYKKRASLRAENVIFITLNPVFREYIEGVLPDLGERDPQMLTWMDFLRSLHVPIEDPGLDARSASLRAMEEALPSFRLEEEDILPVRQGDEIVLGRSEVLEVLRRFDKALPAGVRLIQVTADALAEEAKAVLRRREKKAREEDGEEETRGGAPSGAQGQESGTRADDPDGALSGPERLARESASRRSGRAAAERREDNRLESRYGGAFAAIRSCEWLDFGQICRRLLKGAPQAGNAPGGSAGAGKGGKSRVTSVEWLYLRLLLTGECDRTAQYVCVDEIQDYTEAQLMVLARYWPNAHFLLLGDEFQAIREGTVSFADMEALFGRLKKRFVRLSLETSYRSTPEITALFASLLPKEQRLRANSVQREGTAPQIIAAASHEEYEAELSRAIAASQREDEGLTAVLCESRRSLQRLQELPCAAALPVVSGQNLLPKQGVFLIPLRYAKGLEFDRVILPDADAAHYPDEPLSRRRLYTAISRATCKITILADGALTPLLGDGSTGQ